MNGVMAQRVAEGESYLTLGGHRNLVSGGGCEEFGKGHPRQRQSPESKGSGGQVMVTEARWVEVMEAKESMRLDM